MTPDSLLEPLRLWRLELRRRIVMAPMHGGLASPAAEVTEAPIREYLGDLVRRGDVAAEAAASELEELFRTSTMVVGERRWSRECLHEL